MVMNATPCFAGRVDELQFLFQSLGKAAQGDPQLIFLEGAPGTGKSALLQMFGVRAAHREKSSYTFYIVAPSSGDYLPISQAALEATNKQLYDRVGGRRKAIDTARELLPDWVGAIPGIGDLTAAILATAQAIRRRRQPKRPARSLAVDEDTEALLNVAARRPLVLLFDDLHAADSTAISQLERLIRATAAGAKLLVVASYCPTPPGVADPPIHQLIATLPGDSFQRRRLGELSIPELELWMKKRFPHVQLPKSFLEWVFNQTGGHAASVDSLLARLIDRSVIRFIDRRWQIQEDLEAHESLVESGTAGVLAVDLSAIRPEVVDVLRGASVLGDEFDGLTLSLLLEQDELYVEDQLAFATRHNLVESIGETTRAGEIATLYRFSSSHLRTVLARDLSAEQKGAFTLRHAAMAGEG